MAIKILKWLLIASGVVAIGCVGYVMLLKYLFSPQFVETRNPDLYLIPEGYTGRVEIYYEVKDAPPLPMEGRFRVNLIPPDGVLNTSSPALVGIGEDKYFYVDAQGNRKALNQEEYIHGHTVGRRQISEKGVLRTTAILGAFTVSYQPKK